MTPVDAPVIAPLHPPRRILLGPGPSPVDERVLRAMSAPLLGHLDPLFVRTMDDVQALLRYVFETNNRLTFPVSGTGSAGMEAALVNLLEPGEEVVICVNGYFGERMCEMATRIGAQPLRVASSTNILPSASTFTATGRRNRHSGSRSTLRRALRMSGFASI